ncbi:hypothetical protein RB215_08455 [Pseudoalteromonas sp. HL-AS2]|uniref:hypothetical protein n=1 Tax=Pseudoalteromonas sp. HL-AS2 TaxID=3071082 RepID=UPI0028154A4C|nr:hypothetical protein [Pseudoalteromonas sp. HL-AS2]WMS93333.1 hypothetical protein RB215_08455 [Pseudoalteromonas sp. HL-AS2]
MAVFANTYLLQTKQPVFDAKSMLWPVHMWQVYTNSPKGRKLNVFEKTILQLFKVSDKRSLSHDDIGKWLGLESDMVSYIIAAQLIPNGWLTEKGKITESALKMLDEKPSENLTTAYVFQCAITKQWLPRVCFDLNEIYSNNVSGNPRFKFKRESDYESRPFVINTKNVNVQPPREQDLKSIAIDYQEAIYVAQNTRDNDEWKPQQSSFDKLTLVDSSHEAVYLTVWGDTQTSFEWTLYDPFGVSTKSTWMKELFKHGCKANKGLGQMAVSELGSVDANMSYEEACASFAETAKFDLLVKYPNTDKITGLTDVLFEMVEAHKRITHERNTSQKIPHNSAKAKLIVSCGQVLEVICEHLLKEYELTDSHRLPKPHTKNGTEIISHLIVEATNMSVDMLAESTRVQPSRVYSAAIGKNSSLRAQLVAIFISMATHREHPMKFLLDDETYFKDFYSLTFLRDDCAHKKPPAVSLDTANNAVDLIQTFVTKLFNGI